MSRINCTMALVGTKEKIKWIKHQNRHLCCVCVTLILLRQYTPSELTYFFFLRTETIFHIEKRRRKIEERNFCKTSNVRATNTNNWAKLKLSCVARLAPIFVSRLSRWNPAPYFSSKHKPFEAFSSFVWYIVCCLRHHSIPYFCVVQLQHNFLYIVGIAWYGMAWHSPIPLNSFIIYSSLRFSRIINENGIRKCKQ